MRRAAIAIVLLSGVAAADETPYLYHRLPTEAGLRLELETGIGTREARPFGEDGVEQAVRVEVAPLPWLAVSARGGALFTDGEVRAAAGVEVLGGLGGLRLAAGVRRDYREDVVLSFRGVGSFERGRVALAASGLVEVPLAEDRDAVDLVLGVAAMFAVSRDLRLGGELLVEDLEGLWEAEEAEGGARALAGPAVWLRLGARLDLKLNLALTASRDGAGFLGRAAVGAIF